MGAKQRCVLVLRYSANSCNLIPLASKDFSLPEADQNDVLFYAERFRCVKTWHRHGGILLFLGKLVYVIKIFQSSSLFFCL